MFSHICVYYASAVFVLRPGRIQNSYNIKTAEVRPTLCVNPPSMVYQCVRERVSIGNGVVAFSLLCQQFNVRRPFSVAVTEARRNRIVLRIKYLRATVDDRR